MFQTEAELVVAKAEEDVAKAKLDVAKAKLDVTKAELEECERTLKRLKAWENLLVRISYGSIKLTTS